MSMEIEMRRRTKSDSDVMRVAQWSPKLEASTSTNINNYVQSPPRPVLAGPTVDIKSPPMQDLEAGEPEITEFMPANSDLKTSLVASLPPRSPKHGAGTNKIHYYVDIPSHDGEGGGSKSSSMHATPTFNAPNESPSYLSACHHSRASSISRFFGIFRNGGGKLKSVNAKGWPECNVILEEGSYKGLYGGDSGLSRCWKIALAFISLALVLTFIFLNMWSAARPYMPDVIIKTITIDDFHAGEGIEHSAVPTKLVTVNCSVNLVVYNPASKFGIHVTSGPILLIYSDITIGVGQVPKYYQPRNSHHQVSAVIHGHKVPLYSAGGGLDLSSDDGSVPLTLDFVLISRGYVISNLMWVTHNVHVTCNITINAKATGPIRFPKDACTMYKA